jgi:hypothetical protein
MKNRLNLKIVSLLLLLSAQLSHPLPELFKGRTFPEADFFKDTVGVDEKQFRKDFRWNEKTGVLDAVVDRWKNPEGPAAREAAAYEPWIQEHSRRQAIFNGSIHFETVEDLNRALGEKKGEAGGRLRPLPGDPAKFNILLHNPADPSATDVTDLQADPRNKNAVFQVASTMYGPLEGRIAYPNVSLGKMLICPGHGPAQGERASISATPATIYRKYFMPTEIQIKRLKGENIPHLKKEDGNYFYLLSELSERAPRNSQNPLIQFIFKNQKADVNVVRKNKFSLKEDVPMVGIFTHADIDVTVKHAQEKNHLESIPLEEQQKITQTFNAAHDMEFSYWPWKNQNEIDFAKVVLRGMYEGTLKKAYLLGKKKVFLTLLGGGVFKNDMNWVAEIFEDESMRKFIKESGLEVNLIYRSKSDPAVLERFYRAAYNINADAPNRADEERIVNEEMTSAASLLPPKETSWTRIKKWFLPAISAGAACAVYIRHKKDNSTPP